MRRAGIIRVALIALVALCALPASASATTVVGKTTKGGSCRIETIASRAGTALTFGGLVDNCSARFGIRSVEGRGLLYEEPPTDKIIRDITEAGPGNAPYERTATYEEGEADVPYSATWGATVVIKTRKSPGRPKKPEQWVDPGPHCRVYTSFHSSDTLGCTIDQDF
jgi:hypothetical protein